AKMKISEQAANRAAYICQHVFDVSREMGYVGYNDDGDDPYILITCIDGDHDFSSSEEIHVVGLGHLVARDPTLLDIPDLQPGTWAVRSKAGQAWRVVKTGGP